MKTASYAKHLRFSSLDKLMITISNFSRVIGSVFIFTIFSLVLFFRRKKKHLYLFISSFFLAIASEMILKEIVERARPISRLIVETSYSFPSAHSIVAVVFLLSSIILIAPLIKKPFEKVIFILFVSILFPLVIIGRIYLSAHYLSDVLASIFLGIACFIIADIATEKSLLKNTKYVINKK
jgi:undecaprenyl-diphosphatase